MGTISVSYPSELSFGRAQADLDLDEDIKDLATDHGGRIVNRGFAKVLGAGGNSRTFEIRFPDGPEERFLDDIATVFPQAEAHKI